MERVNGIGGYFLRTADPVAMTAWYRDVLGVDFGDHGLWQQPAGPTVMAMFGADTDYFGTRPENQDRQQTMLNFRVGDLDAMIAQLQGAGAEVAPETEDMDGIGRFGWVTDPEGNRIELWEPVEQG
ncbi:VOC family protein [Brevibacterium sp. JSBI002]|uniref:VOC family protein n=1 Tax=Brevibacterium sp. JSBI002 TaxID=2886045 RepID=UPI002232319F|nr:VOC family protein [Brevibacterium sp. JSBI002]UZD62313.1 VOC family protein [Brevibacterium sp. JSBI002]